MDGAASSLLHVRRMGSGPVPVVAVHCALASANAWGALARALPEATVHGFDLPGHGRSPDVAPDEDAQGVAANFTLRLMGEGAHLIGHSYGATVALRAALTDPARVRSLTLIEPVLFAALRGGPAYRDVQALQAPFQAALRAGDRAQAARLFHGMWGGGGPGFESLPQAVQDNWIARIHLIEQQRPALHDDTGGLLRPGGLEGLNMPVTLLHGADSPAPIRAIEEVLAACLSAPERITVPGAGHMVALTHPQAVAEALRARF